MRLPVDTVVTTHETGFPVLTWHFSHHDEEAGLFHVFSNQKSSVVANNDTEVYSSIEVMLNQPMMHSGGKAPVSNDIYVRVARRNNTQEKGLAGDFTDWEWDGQPKDSDIIGFQILGDSISQPDMFKEEHIDKPVSVEDPKDFSMQASPSYNYSFEHPKPFISLSPDFDSVIEQTKESVLPNPELVETKIPKDQPVIEPTFIPEPTELSKEHTKYDKTLMLNAKAWEKESKCKRLQVGAVLAIEGRSIMSGYNGTVEGSDNCCEDKTYYKGPLDSTSQYANDAEYRKGIQEKYPYEDDKGRYFLTSKLNVLHAEKNVILFCAKKGIPTEGATLYATRSPCKLCAADIAQAGIKRVVFENFYRDHEGVDELRKYGIRVDRCYKL